MISKDDIPDMGKNLVITSYNLIYGKNSTYLWRGLGQGETAKFYNLVILTIKNNIDIYPNPETGEAEYFLDDNSPVLILSKYGKIYSYTKICTSNICGRMKFYGSDLVLSRKVALENFYKTIKRKKNAGYTFTLDQSFTYSIDKASPDAEYTEIDDSKEKLSEYIRWLKIFIKRRARSGDIEAIAFLREFSNTKTSSTNMDLITEEMKLEPIIVRRTNPLFGSW